MVKKVAREKIVTCLKADQETGFSLFELLVVIAILTLSITVVTSSLRPHLGRYAGKAEAATILSSLQKAQQQSVFLARPISVEFSQNSFQSSLADGEHEIDRRLTLEPTVISFWPDGTSSGGEVILNAAQVRYLYSIDAYTGQVTASQSARS